MRFLIVNTDYPEFLASLYARNTRLSTRSYEEQMLVRNASLFGVADFYPTNLGKLGHETHEIHVNNTAMQRAWAREHGLGSVPGWQWPLRLVRRTLPPSFFSSPQTDPSLLSILAAQIAYYAPEVLLDHVGTLTNDFLKEIKPQVRLLVGQIAAPLPPNHDFACYDLVLSSLPNLLAHFRDLGLSAELHRLGFEPALLARLQRDPRPIPLSFVGTLSSAHTARLDLLAYLCNRVALGVWGHQIHPLPPDSPISARYGGPAWGVDMYHVLYNSRITVNHHIDMAGPYANNMRLFEATGVGTLLVTDWKVNLHEMFEPGTEVLAYRTREECAELLEYYLEHETERAAIARAGQQRTLRDHTYLQRMQELVDIVERYL